MISLTSGLPFSNKVNEQHLHESVQELAGIGGGNTVHLILFIILRELRLNIFILIT